MEETDDDYVLYVCINCDEVFYDHPDDPDGCCPACGHCDVEKM